jgi:hypothetical protein
VEGDFGAVEGVGDGVGDGVDDGVDDDVGLAAAAPELESLAAEDL